MTDSTVLINLALQSFGSRTTINAAQLAGNTNNEAKQANLAFENTRDGLLRMAPWNCGLKTANLNYITSIPGTPENTSPATNLWAPGQPRPPWAYEYQYPVDCLRPCWIISQSQTGTMSIPITTAVTGGSPIVPIAGPITYKIGIDSFVPVIAAAAASGGSGYAPGDQITLAAGAAGAVPIGAPAVLTVLTAPGGVIGTVSIVSQVIDSVPAFGGSYFAQQPNPVAQGSTTGFGTGATFNLTYGPASDQRVILTNQEFATLVYVRQVTDTNVWDPLLQDAFYHALGANLCMALTGDKSLANICISKANRAIEDARKADGNEGLTINDFTPDWIRVRGMVWIDGPTTGPYGWFDWGGLIPSY